MKSTGQNKIFLLTPILKIVMTFHREYIETKVVKKFYQNIDNCGRGKLLNKHVLCYYLKNMNFVKFG